MVESYGDSDKGCVRTDNEDRILEDHHLGIFLVADGMGGHSHGERAAELAVSTIRYYLESSEDRFDVTWPYGYDFNYSIDANRLITAIQLANQQVWRSAQQGPEYAGMGTTVAALLTAENGVVIGNVGDSRVYLHRQARLEQVTVDDTFVNSVARHGQLTEEEINSHPMRNVLMQAAGTQEKLEVHICERAVESGDTYLICSDGLHSVLNDDAIRHVLGASDSIGGIVMRLIDAAKAAGGPDNVSCVVVRFEV